MHRPITILPAPPTNIASLVFPTGPIEGALHLLRLLLFWLHCTLLYFRQLTGFVSSIVVGMLLEHTQHTSKGAKRFLPPTTVPGETARRIDCVGGIFCLLPGSFHLGYLWAFNAGR